MNLIKFLKRHLAPFGIVLGGLLTAYGYLSDALELYQAGMPAWVWQIMGVLVVIASLLVFVHRNEALGMSQTIHEDPANAPILAEERPEHADEQRRQRVIIGEILTTARSAGWALGSRDIERMRLELPGMRATLLTVSKAYDLAIPEFARETSPRRSLEAGARYLTDIGALLRQGHVEEARASANELVPTLNAYLSGERDLL